MRGMSQLDLTVQIERLRAVNDATTDDEEFEERCLTVLDLVHGVTHDSLVWDAAHEAAALLPRAIGREELAGATTHALVPSDLLPPRATPDETQVVDVAGLLGESVGRVIEAFELRPQRAAIVRAPKGAFTSRPAAVLAFPDRLIFEALASVVEGKLDDALPEMVIWPRNRTDKGSATYTQRVVDWQSAYVVKADVSHFFESIDHSLLAVFLTTHLRVSTVVARAIEAFLDATMGFRRGLPQGPLASDVLASAYLLPLDLRLAESATPYLRYADDYYFPVQNLGQGRRLLQRMERWLNDIGLALNSEKTSIMRMSSFVEGLEHHGVHRLKERLVDERRELLEQAEDADDAAGILERTGIPDDTIWALLYHHSVTIEDVFDQLVTGNAEEFEDVYGYFFRQCATILRRGDNNDEIPAVASLALECLALLARTDVQLPDRDLAEVHRWFPQLTPHVVEYLTRGTHSTWNLSVEYIRSMLTQPTCVDWVDAWMCHAASKLDPTDFPRDELRSIAQDRQVAPLTATEAVRSLAFHQQLEELDWRQAYERVGPALGSEMLFAGLEMRERAPWLRLYLTAAAAPGVRAILEAVESRE